MKDQNKTKARLIAELDEMRRRIADLESGVETSDERTGIEKYRTYIENSPGALFVCDSECRLLDINRISSRLTGYSREELLEKAFVDLVPAGSVEDLKNKLDRLKDSGEIESEIVLQSKSGALIHSSLDAVSLSDGHLMAYCFDISRRKQAEQALRESEEKFRGVIERSQDGIILADDRGVVVEMNRGGEKIFGLSRSEVIGQFVWDIQFRLLPENRRLPSMLEKLKSAALMFLGAERPSWPAPYPESEIERPDGSRRIIESAMFLLPLEQGVMACSVVRDITDRKNAEGELRETRDLLEGILNVIPDVIGVQERDHTIIRYNQAGYEFLNMGPEETHGKKCYELIGRHLPCEMCATTKSYRSKKPEKIEKYTESLGTWLDVRAYPVLDENGEVVKVVEHLRDITERKKAEEEKARLEDQYRQVMKVEAIGRLAGGVAHDLNNMLSPILGYGEMLLGDMTSEDKRRTLVEDIIRAGFRARDLVRQLLAFSRKQTLEYKPVDMNEVVTGFEKLLRRTIREDIAIEIVPGQKMLTVMADVGQIEQVIMNLAVNAQDAMPEGGRLTIQTTVMELDETSVAIHRDLKAGEYVMLAISDTGHGMDEEVTKHLFEPFYSTKGEQGTGLGLATVYGIVKQHGGAIWVYSEPGEGTVFKIYLPITEKVPVDEKKDRVPVSDLTGTETIMLVEDNEQVRHLALEILKRQGYAVLVALNGPEALEIMRLHRGPVHLLFTDVVLPGMNGRELYSKAVESQPNLRVLYMSGYIDEVIAHRGVLEQGVAFIQKPFTVQALTEKVREVLDR
jgi:PAS domain S-box-containing protein